MFPITIGAEPCTEPMPDGKPGACLCPGEAASGQPGPVNDSVSVPEPGETRSSFCTTHWSVVLASGRTASPEVTHALDQLCRTYYYPLYAYVRRQGHNAPDAQDLVQAFFARFLERNYVRLADRSRGRFRTFLLSSLQHFLINEWQKNNRQKRGSSTRVVSLDAEFAESQFESEPSVNAPPDTLYDRGWAFALMQRALELLKTEFEDSSREELFQRLRVFVWGEKSGLPYSLMAAQLGMTEGAVKVAVHRLRQRYGELLRSEIAATVATPVEVDEELRYLCSVVRDSLQ